MTTLYPFALSIGDKVQSLNSTELSVVNVLVTPHSSMGTQTATVVTDDRKISLLGYFPVIGWRVRQILGDIDETTKEINSVFGEPTKEEIISWDNFPADFLTSP